MRTTAGSAESGQQALHEVVRRLLPKDVSGTGEGSPVLNDKLTSCGV